MQDEFLKQKKKLINFDFDFFLNKVFFGKKRRKFDFDL